MLQVCAMVIVSCIRSNELERPLSVVVPGPSSGWYDVVEKGVEIDVWCK